MATRGQMASFEMGATPSLLEFSPDGRNLIVICGSNANDLDEIRILRAQLLEEIDLDSMISVVTEEP